MSVVYICTDNKPLNEEDNQTDFKLVWWGHLGTVKHCKRKEKF